MDKPSLRALRELHDGMFKRGDPTTALPEIVAALPALLAIAEAARAFFNHDASCLCEDPECPGRCVALRAALAMVEE